MKKLPRANILIVGLLLVIALLPRSFGLGRALTNDEAYQWQDRSAIFLAALLEGHLAETAITEHPGVMTMWLGSGGLLLERMLLHRGLIPPTTFEWERPVLDQDIAFGERLKRIGIDSPAAYETHLTLMRLPLAWATALLIVLAYLLLRRLLDPRVALVAALLWATDPFLVAHSRVLHVDALLTLFMLLGTLALILAGFDKTGPRERLHMPLVILGGVATGLALLAKVTAGLMLPIGVLIIGAWYWQRRHAPQTQPMQMALVALVTWGGLTLLTIFVGWPALWVAPRQTLELVFAGASDEGGSPYKFNFLLGHAYRHTDPGPLFYPVTLLSRTTPWVLLGWVGLLVEAVRRWSWLQPRRGVMLLFLLIPLGILTALTIVPQKFDRYALPAIPLLHILAASGLLWIGMQLRGWLRFVGGCVLAASAAVTLGLFHPYYLAYYSPLLGGSSQAVKLVPVGWGEGMDLVADWLNARPDITAGKVAVWPHVTLHPYLYTDVSGQGTSAAAINYLVVYVSQTQTGFESGQYDAFYPNCPPLHTVQIHGIDYAWIYKVHHPLLREDLAVQFGETVALDRVELRTADVCTCSPATIKLWLQPVNPPTQPLFLFIHLLDAQGATVAQYDLPLAGVIPAAAWQSGEVVPYGLEMRTAAGLPPGRYQVALGLYQAADGVRLPVQTGAELPAGFAALNAFPVGTLDLGDIDHVVATCGPD